MRPQRSIRQAFTLIEMLVTIGIILTLVTLAVTFLPEAQDRQRSASGASAVQYALLTAKQRAKHEQAISGVRLIPDPTHAPNQYVTQLQYITQAADFLVKPGVNAASPPIRRLLFTAGSSTVSLEDTTFPTPNFAGDYPANRTLWHIQDGDYLEVDFNGPSAQVFRVTIDPTNPLIVNVFPPVSTLPLANPTDQYRFVRQARPRLGESSVRLPENVVIDLNTNVTYANPGPWPTATQVDILFSPTGMVTGWGSSSDKIHFWVRDLDGVNIFDRAQLITVFVRTGLIGAFPLEPTGTNPYLHAEQGRTAGL